MVLRFYLVLFALHLQLIWTGLDRLLESVKSALAGRLRQWVYVYYSYSEHCGSLCQLNQVDFGSGCVYYSYSEHCGHCGSLCQLNQLWLVDFGSGCMCTIYSYSEHCGSLCQLNQLWPVDFGSGCVYYSYSEHYVSPCLAAWLAAS